MRKSLFILGDSISVHYTPWLSKFLGSDWNVSRKGDIPAPVIVDEPEHENGGDSRMVHEYLCAVLPSINADFILLNCGLHDIKRLPIDPNRNQIPLEQYQRNLLDIIQMLHDRGKTIFWTTITPVDDRRHRMMNPNFLRFDSDVFLYNNAAKQIMMEAGIEVFDLGGFTRKLSGEIYADHVHYLEETVKLQAAFLAGCLEIIAKN